MAPADFISDNALDGIARALQEGDAEHAFILLADYLATNKLTLSDDVLRIYLQKELFSCLKDQGDLFKGP